MSTLVLIRGLPGSGKSTKALEYKKQGYDHFEADMYFIDSDGKYVFNPSLIIDAHDWCVQMAYLSIIDGHDVVISNTFTQMWQMKPYIEIALKNGYNIKIIEMKNDYGDIHNVPEESLKRMKKNWRPLRDDWEQFLSES